MSAAPLPPDNDFVTFNTVAQNVGYNTVDRLKLIISSLNRHLHWNLSRSGRKGEMIDRIRGNLDALKTNRDTVRWHLARQVLANPYEAPSTSNMPSAVSASTSSNPSPAYGYPSSSAQSSAQSSVPNGYAKATSSHIASPPAHVSSWSNAVPGSSRLPTTSKSTIRFKPSPFHYVEQPLSDVSAASEVRTSQDRGTATVSWSVTEAQRSLVTAGTHQMRLYCTSSAFYSPGSWASGICPIEFPPVCEVRVNGYSVQANTRGMKKKPGTAPPVDVSRHVRVGSNRVDMSFMNNTNPFVHKRYYCVVNLVRISTIPTLISRLRSGKVRTADSVKQSIWKRDADDDDVQVGTQEVSLKCPLSYMRIVTPARSQACLHGQCFDATSWYSMNEQTTTYACPVCDKTLNPEELILDGFFDQILSETPEETEAVKIEPDGEWHTADGKHHSSGWQPPSSRASRAPSMVRPPIVPDVRRSSSLAGASSDPRSTSKAPLAPKDVFVIDSDDGEDEYHVNAQLNRSGSTVQRQHHGFAPDSRSAMNKQNGGLIDLTVDSEDDDGPARDGHSAAAARQNSDLNQNGKRRADNISSDTDAARPGAVANSHWGDPNKRIR